MDSKYSNYEPSKWIRFLSLLVRTKLENFSSNAKAIHHKQFLTKIDKRNNKYFLAIQHTGFP